MTLEAVQERFPSALPAHTFQAYQEYPAAPAVLKKSAGILWKPSGKPVFLLLDSQGTFPCQKPGYSDFFRDYIGSHYTQDIGLADLSSLVDMSPAAVSTFFKEQAGMSYVKYLTRKSALNMPWNS